MTLFLSKFKSKRNYQFFILNLQLHIVQCWHHRNQNRKDKKSVTK